MHYVIITQSKQCYLIIADNEQEAYLIADERLAVNTKTAIIEEIDSFYDYNSGLSISKN